MVLMSIFDCVDDTKYVFKAIITEIATNMKDIVFHETGRKVVMYLLAGRNQTYTHPQVSNKVLISFMYCSTKIIL